MLFRNGLKLALRHRTIKTQRGREGAGDGVAGGKMPGEALLRGPWALWQRDPAKELCCDKSDSQPYFYSSINLIGEKKNIGARQPWRLRVGRKLASYVSGAALVEHALMTIIYFLLSSWSQILICCRSV